MHEKLFHRNQFNFCIVIIECDFCFNTYFNHCVILNNKFYDHSMHGSKMIWSISYGVGGATDVSSSQLLIGHISCRSK